MLTLKHMTDISDKRSRSQVRVQLRDAFNKHAPAYGVTKPKRVAQFLGNVSHESSGFTRMTESMNYSVEGLLNGFGRHRISARDAKRYGRTKKRRANQKAIANCLYGGEWGRENLGNTQPNDGWVHRGSGPGQVTGAANFKTAADETGIPFDKQPELMRDPEKAMLAALILWQKWGLNELADKGATTAIRKKWNGGRKGLSEVEEMVDRALSCNISFGSNGAKIKPAPKTPAKKPLVRAKGLPQQPDDITRQVIEEWKHLIPEKHRDNPVVLLAVRGYFRDSMGKVGENDKGIFDDAAFLVSPRGVWAYNFNVDPSRDRKRIAQYKAPQAVSFKQGIHGHSKPKARRYRAFEQVSKAHIHRHAVGKDYGDFSMNIHRGSKSGGTSSAGCCTVPYGKQWDDFFAQACKEMDAEGQRLLWMVLLEYPGGHPPITKDVVIKKVEKVVTKSPTGPVVVAVGGGLFVWISDKLTNWWDALTSYIGSFFG